MSIVLFIIVVLSSITNVTHCGVYYVISDDDGNGGGGSDDGSCCSNNSCDQCYNLQHYLLNATKYFTAHTQIHFLPGLHYLTTNLVIQNVSNISLIGSAVNGRDTTIRCTGTYYIILANNNYLEIKDLVVTRCGYDVQPDNILITNTDSFALSTIQLYYCSFVTILNIKIMSRSIHDTLINVNTIGHSVFHNISSAGISFIYDDATENNTNVHVLINNYQCNFNTHRYKFDFKIMLYKSTIYLKIVNITVCSILDLHIITDSCSHYVIDISNCICSGEIAHKNLVSFEIQEHDKHQCINKENEIKFKNCHFINIFRQQTLTLIKVSSSGTVNIVDCTFHNTTNIIPFEHISKYKSSLNIYHQAVTTLIKNTSFISNTIPSPFALITLSEQVLLLEGPVSFIDAQLAAFSIQQAMIYASNAVVHFHNYIEISNCSGFIMFQNVLFFVLRQSVTVNINHNHFAHLAHYDEFMTDLDVPPICMFQYFNEESLDSLFEKNVTLNYSIIFKANKWISRATLNHYGLRITHCNWLVGSAFNVTLPIDVNQRFITFINETFAINKKKLCYCTENGTINCYKDRLGPIYPGQTLNIMLAYAYPNTELIIDVNDIRLPATACKVSSLQETKQIVTQSCTILKYTIPQINNRKWCELIFKAHGSGLLTSNDAFYITFNSCPIGYIKINGRCQCDPILNSNMLSIDDCDINDQTILRPANSWISAKYSNNGTFTYLVSLDCPFDYCLPYTSRLNLSFTADLQCQFRRHNLLCGQCSDGLSTVFGSSHCQQCSNVYLFIIIPIAILGLLLVVLLFFLNLTVVDGTINAFILYVNIVSINSTIIFPSRDTASILSYVFISVSNLDIGIQMCFYNGMDDYAKMWLQLLFPVYLIFIATILIMASRYSSKVQRLTARRALPVLATLFLLSYTKILRTVSNVLFSYSTIIHLPSNHSKLVWSVDANVKLFEIKFIALFIVCVLIFILLIPFNITLLFTRTLSRFKTVNYFKPLLDVYQAPFKIKFYYWIGLHLVMKALFFGLSALDNRTNLLIGSMILIATEGIVGYIRPYRKWFQNCHEMILVFNLTTQFVLISSGQTVTIVNMMIALAAVQFTFIIIYHIVNYTAGRVIKNRMQLCVSTLANSITKKFNSTDAFKLHDVFYRNNIPDVTYKYSEFQEPLVAED